MYNITADTINSANKLILVFEAGLSALKGHYEAYHEFGLDEEVFMSSEGDVFLHDAEVIEPTEQKTAAVCPQVKVHFFTCEPTHTCILLDSTGALFITKLHDLPSQSANSHRLRSYWTFWVRSTFSMMRSWR